jgi:hypothetical protein
MDNHKHPCQSAETEQKKSPLLLGVERIVEQQGIRIVKYRSCFLKPDAMLSVILPVLSFVPLERKQI